MTIFLPQLPQCWDSSAQLPHCFSNMFSNILPQDLCTGNSILGMLSLVSWVIFPSTLRSAHKCHLAQGVLPSFVCCTPSECSISPIIILRRGVTKLSMLALNLLGSPGRCGSPASAPQTADPRSVLSGSRVCF